MEDINIARFTRFMEDLEQGKVEKFNRVQIMEENLKVYTTLLGEATATTPSATSAGEEFGNMTQKAVNFIGGQLRKAGFGMSKVVKDAILAAEEKLFKNRKELSQYVKTVDELYRSYRVELFALVEAHAPEFDIFSRAFFKDAMDVMGVTPEQAQVYMKNNERTIIDMNREMKEIVRKIKSEIPEDMSKYSIQQYMLATKPKERSSKFSELIREYKKTVEKLTTTKFLPTIKNHTQYLVLEYIKLKNKNSLTPEIQESTVNKVYSMFELLESDHG